MTKLNIKEVNWEKMKWQYRPRIEYLTSSFSGDIGDRFTILLETEDTICFNDVNDRWVYVNKCDEGIDFKYIRRGRWTE